MDSKTNFKKIFSSFHLRLMTLFGLIVGRVLIELFNPILLSYKSVEEAKLSEYLGYQIGYILYYTAIPILGFLIVTGVKNTSNVLKYLVRLGIAGMVTQVAVWLSLYGFDASRWGETRLNLYFTIILGMLAVTVMDRVIKVKWPKGTVGYNVFNILIIVVALVIGELTRVEQGGLGVLLIIAFYMFYESRFISMLAVAALMIVTLGSAGGFIMYAPVLGCFITWFYSGERGNNHPAVRGAFYAVYPVCYVALIFYMKAKGLI